MLRPILRPLVARDSRRVRRASPRPSVERLESRLTPAATLLDIAAPRPAEPGFPAMPALPIPAGATLVDTSDSGLQVLFSSADPNVIPGQETVPFLAGMQGNLFWMDLSAGLDAPVIRLVTHFAGSTIASTGYTGIGTGLVEPFVPGSADLSGDGRTVVFDSWINAHDYDASVPAANDQPSTGQLVVAIPLGGSGYQIVASGEMGSADVFVWHAMAPDPANNITAVSLLNATGKAEAVLQSAIWPAGFPRPDASRPMMTGVFPAEPPLGFDPAWQQFEPTEAATSNHGISEDGKRVLYATNVPAPWVDTVNVAPAIGDATDPLVSPGWTLDGFLVDGIDLPSAAALEKSGSTRTVTKYQGTVGPVALGGYVNGLPWGRGSVPADVFVAFYLQLSANGNRVVYSTRTPANVLVPGTTDTNLSLDVFAYDVATDRNIVVSTQAGRPGVAAGAGQADYPTTAPPPGTLVSMELFTSMNHSVSRDGTTIAITSSAANLTFTLVDNNVTLRPTGVIVSPGLPGSGFAASFRQQAPFDVYAVRPDTRTAFLVNTPDGRANTNLDATFGGMSADGTTFLFGTAANNFSTPAFGKPPFLPFATGPVPKNFLLGGWSHLWARNVDRATTTLVSVSAANNSSGNKATLASAVLPGARDLLPNISDTGRFVLFSTASNNVVAGINDPGFKGGVFLRDMQTGVSTLVSTTTTGNVPSAGAFLTSSLAADDVRGVARVFLGGTGGGDMQGRFRRDDVDALTPHLYALDYPVVVPAASATSRDVFAVSGNGPFARTVVEYRGPVATVRSSPGELLPGFAGEWRVATGDVTGDGVADTVWGAGPGGRDMVIVIDGRTNAPWMQVRAFSNIPRGGGVFVATGDVNRDGFADVIVGTDGPRAARVLVFNGRRGEVLEDFLPFGNGKPVRVGARVAGGDVDGDGHADVIVASGPGLKPRAEVYSGRALTTDAAVTRMAAFALSSVPGKPQAGNGAYVSAADMNGDGRAELVVSFNASPTVSVVEGTTGSVLSSVNLATGLGLGAGFSRGVTVAARANRVAVATGPGVAPATRILAFKNLSWSVESIQPPPVSTAARTGLYVG